MASNMSEILSSNAMRPRRRKVQNYLLIWVDENIDVKNEDCQNTLAHLRNVVKEVNVCATSEECIEALIDVDGGKAFVISSGALGQNVVPVIHDMACVDAIYVFCSKKARHEVWTKKWFKIRGVFTTIKPICESLKKVTRECDHNSIPMSFISVQKGSASDENNSKQLPAVYMYSVLYKEIALEIDDDDTKSINNLFKYCREQGIAENELKEFQREYQNNSAVYIYTCELFFYTMLNCALWTLDTKAMTKMAFFVRNLHRQLEQLHKDQINEFKNTFIVYRGQGATEERIQQLINTKGGLLSFNNFLSTSEKQQVAMGFVDRALGKNNLAVLFTMVIDPSKVSTSNTPYATIDGLSAIPSEKEILFSMHTVFNIIDVKQATGNNRLWEVQLTLTDDNDPQLAELTKSMREDIDGTGWPRMAKLMYTLGDFGQAEEFYKELFEILSSDSDRAFIYHKLGNLKDQQGEYQEAVKYYEGSLEIKRKTLPEDHTQLAAIYQQFGLTYDHMGDYSKALEYYKKSLKILEKTLPPNHSS
ncbi:unnamed protein product, partial [Rotaria sp. Silwood2]